MAEVAAAEGAMVAQTVAQEEARLVELAHPGHLSLEQVTLTLMGRGHERVQCARPLTTTVPTC